MSKLGGRVKRLYETTHRFVTLSDWELIRDSWKAPLDDAKMGPDDFSVELAELTKAAEKISGYAEFKNLIDRIAGENCFAYYAYMYKTSLEVIRRNPNGVWIEKRHDVFWEKLRRLRIEARKKSR